MKRSKGIIAVLMVLVIICSFVACSSKNTDEVSTTEVTQAVTDSDGEIVTQENGEVVTETVQGEAVTDSNGTAVTQVVIAKNGVAVTNSSGKTVTQVVTAPHSTTTSATTTTAKQGKSDKTTEKTTTKSSKNDKTDTTSTTKATIKKPSKPANVSSLKSSKVTESSVKLSWGSVDCDGYQIAISYDGGFNWTTLESSYTKGTTYTVKNLTSMTEYYFRVRAYNENSAGKSASEWKKISVTTAEDDTSKYLTITVVLPKNNSVEDTLTITVDGEKVHTAKVKCDGSKYEYKTEKKYKGAVDVSASLKDYKTSKSINTDKDATIDLSAKGIDVLEAEND